MTTKDAFLGRLRTAIGTGAPAPLRPLAVVDRPPDVVPVWPDATLSATDRWVSAFQALGGHVHRTDPEGIGEAIGTAIAGRGPALADERSEVAAGLGALRWPGCGLEAAATAMVGVIDATAGIAATGSIVVDSDRAGRLVSLLPRVAVFVLHAGDIVLTTGDVLRSHAERWPGGPPANVVLITGPSRSGDIEMSLVVGVHGPGEVHAILVE